MDVLRQLKGMRGNGSITRSKGTSGPGMPSDQPTTRKKGFVDWMNFLKPTSEEIDHWHHCWNCGDIFCDKCIHVELSSLQMSMLSQYESVTDAWHYKNSKMNEKMVANPGKPDQMRCSCAMKAQVTQRLNVAKETISRSSGLQSHEDLARKL